MLFTIQETIKDLQSKQAEAGQKEATPTIETFDFKAKFAETKAYAKVCLRNTFYLFTIDVSHLLG